MFLYVIMGDIIKFFDFFYRKYFPEFQSDIIHSSKFHRAFYLFIPFFLISAIIFGFFSKFLIALNLEYNSDSVIPGMIVREMWQYHNYLLQGYHLEGSYTAIFTDILPFHLLIQGITNYNPTALRITCYLIFILTLILFSYLIFRYSRSYFPVFVFLALMLNLDPNSYYYYIIPVLHNGTAFFTALMIILLLDFNTRYRNLLIPIIAGIFMSLLIFSDSIIIMTFLIPFIVYYIFFQKEKTMNSHFVMVFTCVLAFFANIIKNSPILGYFPHHPSIMTIPYMIFINIPLFIRSVLIDINYVTTNIFEKPNVFPYIEGIVLICIVAWALWWTVNIVKSPKDEQEKRIKPLIIFLLLSGLFFFLSFISTITPDTMYTSRYLTFTATTFFVVVALACLKKNNYYLVVICLAIGIGIITNLIYLPTLTYHPDQDKYDLIQYLEANNLSYGFGDYWDSNILTYLANEKIIIRPVESTSSNIISFAWLSSDRWFKDRPPGVNEYFIIEHSDVHLTKNDIDRLIKTTPPVKILDYKNYRIFVFPISTMS